MPQNKPNIFIMMADAWRPDFLGAAGHPMVKTPNMDRIAREGVICDRAYCASAQCAPSRTSFVTGMYPHAHGVQFNHIEMPSCHKTMGHYFRDLKYRTAWIGKGHNHPPRADFGFDVLKLSDGGHLPIWDDDYFIWLEEQGVEPEIREQLWDEIWNTHGTPTRKYRRQSKYLSPVPEDQVQTGWITAESKTFMRESVEAGDPFLLFASHHAPQNHDDLPEPYHSMYDPAEVPAPKNGELDDDLRQVIASYMGKVSMIDAHVGACLDQLESLGVLEDTIVVLTADHGCFLGEFGMRNKMWTYEYDTRIPNIIRYPKQFSGGTRTDALVSNIDVLPTLLEMVGAPIPEAVQGVSQVSVFEGKQERIRDAVFCESGPVGQQRKGLWTEDYQLLYRTGLDKIELYNLKEDPEQKEDLGESPNHAEKRQELLFRMLQEYIFTERYPTPMDKPSLKRQQGLFNRD